MHACVCEREEKSLYHVEIILLFNKQSLASKCSIQSLAANLTKSLMYSTYTNSIKCKIN